MTSPTPETDPDFEALLDYLKRTRGFDFTAYKRSTLTRRVFKRMEALEIGNFVEYQDYLEVHPDEFAHLFDMILINVTGFFRDQPAWDYLAEEIVPRIVEAKKADEPIRVWTAGCASGEEAYTLAMLFAEALGTEQFRARVKLYATDVSEGALTKGRTASYSAKDVEAVPKPLLEKYFRSTGQSYVFDHDLRRNVIFGRHDLIQDSPISRIDLIVCRNTLMYFNGETQQRILSRFHFSLLPGGFLFLGKAEMLLTSSNVFVPVDLKRRVFNKVLKADGERGGLLYRNGNGGVAFNAHAGAPQGGNQIALREAALLSASQPQLLVDMDGMLVFANEAARSLFALTSQDVGRPLQELSVSLRPVELRAYLEKSNLDRRPVVLRSVEWAAAAGGGGRFFEVAIQPLADARRQPVGTSVTYIDVTHLHRLQEELHHCHQDRETAQEELQTTNEELQSTVEELETTNEELQSTNEELETMNEELQSTNEELRTTNEELRQRTDELDGANGFWQAVLGCLSSGMVVIDRNLRVLVWNQRAEDLWGLRAEEVQGQHFLNLDFGLPVDTLKQTIRACLSGESAAVETVVPATNRRGRSIQCRVQSVPLRGRNEAINGAILLMDELSSPSKEV